MMCTAWRDVYQSQHHPHFDVRDGAVRHGVRQGSQTTVPYSKGSGCHVASSLPPRRALPYNTAGDSYTCNINVVELFHTMYFPVA